MVNDNPAPAISKSTRPKTKSSRPKKQNQEQQQQEQQQQQEKQAPTDLMYLPVNDTANNAGTLEASGQFTAPYQPTPVYTQPIPFQSYQRSTTPNQQPMSPFYSSNSSNSNDYSTMDSHHSAGSMLSPYNTTQPGGYEQSSSRNSTPAGEPNYNLIQTDATLEGLAQRWYAYQAVMQKSYAEDPFYKRWTRSKWILLFSALLLLGYSGAILGFSLSYILMKPEDYRIVMEFHSNLVYLSLAGSICGIASALVGLVGIFKESRLYCCGYQDSANLPEYDMRCFPMTTLPGCHRKHWLYEKNLLKTVWTMSFTVASLQLFVMVVALLCSNHINNLLRSARPGLVSFRDKKQN
ncbi:hypothetical protein FBU30_001997 [Linnemannia zychae]|nr:hypothetical protein FBU30_001997 [Linnemannia zychae]